MNTISICNSSIRNFDGLYSLNDLHRAAGNHKQHQASNWLRNQQTVDFIAECEKTQKRVILKKQGLGTFVCKELVIHYAMWISPEFSLLVIQHFLNSLSQVQAASPHQNTVQTRKGLVAAVKQLAQSRGMDYSDAFRLVHHRFNVESIEQLSFAQIGEATEFVQRATLWGEVLDKPQAALSVSLSPLALSEKDVCALAWLTYYAKWMGTELNHLSGALRNLGASDKACELWTVADESRRQIRLCADAVLRLQPFLHDGHYADSVNHALRNMQRFV